ncbi:MAG: UDP-N-acetylmuramoyl-L-alanyl-D-glutamate--2,6-diaminopimelate ligase [Prolixibacteraceae bacterium]|nr:UDP-N-acetylmuramoyl-L-alanyl-D-glutamate--2,6-diaminopimelate ligase [Prolixibacteraceae bacterium]
MITLNELLNEVTTISITGSITAGVEGLAFDSRKVDKYHVFFAIRGAHTDGHRYMDTAIERGAVAIVCEQLPEKIKPGLTYILVENAAKALGQMASAFYGHPSSKLILVGVTGTNGKTTIASLLHRMVMNLGHAAGLLSTIQYLINDEGYPASHTTPDPLQMNRLMAQMVEAGCTYCFMEVSSHAIDQYRIAGLDFDGAIFTNITHDHLDYHLTFDAYLKAKKQFFDGLKTTAFALTNLDDKNGMVMLQNTRAQKLTYSMRTLADFRNKLLESHFDGTLMSINNKEVWTHFVGKFNGYNLLAVYGAAMALGFDSDKVLVEMSKLKPVAGRFEVIASTLGQYAIVDYAHTPDALENVLSTIDDMRSKNEQLICVVGAGGDRDKTKRPEMAAIACRYSTKVILTSDNPRTEDPLAILKDMEAGVDPLHRKSTITIADRREAIKTAVLLAQPGDLILIAGKGHEDYQEINGVKHHFDDREEIKKAFEIL